VPKLILQVTAYVPAVLITILLFATLGLVPFVLPTVSQVVILYIVPAVVRTCVAEAF
jgi:hypothetical protein